MAKPKSHPKKEARRRPYRLKRKAYILNTSIKSKPLITEGNVQVIDNLRHIHEREVKEMKERILRLHADMDNLKKRTTRERQDIVRFANENMISTLLPVIDNFFHAVQSLEKSDDYEAVIGGVKLIYDQLMRTLKESGLEVIDALDKPFDPRYHEAMAVSYDKDYPENQVLEVFREGYQLKDRVLRPAMVRVNKKPEEKKTEQETIKPSPEIKPEPLDKQKE